MKYNNTYDKHNNTNDQINNNYALKTSNNNFMVTVWSGPVR
jgi:hypothetical protein